MVLTHLTNIAANSATAITVPIVGATKPNQLCCARLEAYGAAVRSTAISAHGTPQNPATTTGAIRRDRPGHPP
jgi:hypothetical protein